MKISIFGLGYVGSVSAACFADGGHEVVGVDVDENKVNLINSGNSPIVEDQVGDIIKKVVLEGRLRAVTDGVAAVAETDISLICVGTPSAANGSVYTESVLRVVETMGAAIKAKDTTHHVVVRSTIPPGTTTRIILPALERNSGKKQGEGFEIYFNPEFLREGSCIRDFYNPPFTIVGKLEGQNGDAVKKLYANIDAPFILTDMSVAETVKYFCNAYHALKVAFANEVGSFCRSYGIDSHKAMDVFCMDTKLNISAAYLKPGFAFGGSCLPKDLRAILYQSRTKDLNLPLLASILPSNDAHLNRSLAMVTSFGKKRIGIMGLSFKAGTDDLRESPMVRLVENLIGKGYDLNIYDRNVSLARLSGANKEFIEREIPHISRLLVSDLSELVEHSEVLVVGNKEPEFAQILQSAAVQDKQVVDLVRIIESTDVQSSEFYSGIAW